jgi:hypothetical protein
MTQWHSEVMARLEAYKSTQAATYKLEEAIDAFYDGKEKLEHALSDLKLDTRQLETQPSLVDAAEGYLLTREESFNLLAQDINKLWEAGVNVEVPLYMEERILHKT